MKCENCGEADMVYVGAEFPGDYPFECPKCGAWAKEQVEVTLTPDEWTTVKVALFMAARIENDKFSLHILQALSAIRDQTGVVAGAIL